MSDFLRKLIPDSNRVDVAFARSLRSSNVLEAVYSPGSGFIGAFQDTDEHPEWSRRAARYLRDEFYRDTPGRIKLFTDVPDVTANGDGECHINTIYALREWEKSSKKGIEPFSLFQDYGSCVDASAAEGITALIGYRASDTQFGEEWRNSVAWYGYADRGYCQDGWYGMACGTVYLRNGIAFRQKYESGSNKVDFTDDDVNEQVVARTWCRTGAPAWIKEITRRDHAFEDGAITEFNDASMFGLKRLFASKGFLHTSGTKTSGGSTPFMIGPVGPHMQTCYGYDDSDKFREHCESVIGVKARAYDFPVLMGQTWGANWSGSVQARYWPAWWGPIPQGSWIWWATDLLRYLSLDVAYLPRVKGFPSNNPPPPVPTPVPAIDGELYGEQVGNRIVIRGELSQTVGITTNRYIVVPNGGKFRVIPKPVV